MPDIIKEPRPNAISLILPVMALVPIQAPIAPVQIILLEQSHQVIPGNVLLVVAEFPHQERHAVVKSADVELVVEQLLAEGFLGADVPHPEDPGEAVEVPSVDQFVRHVKPAWCIFHISEVQLVVNPAHKNQPMRGNVQHLIARNLRSNPPISLLLPTAPRRRLHPSPPNLISQIHPNHPRIIPIPLRQLSQTFKKLLLRVLLIIPQSIAVTWPTTPLGFTRVVVQDYHQARFCYCLDCYVENLHRCLAVQLWVGFYQLVVDFVVTIKHLQREGETDRVHVESVADLLAHVGQFLVLEASNAMTLGMSTGPVAACDFHSFTSSVDYFHALGGEWELDSFDIEERSFGLEILLQFLVLFEELGFVVVILVAHD